MRKYLFACPVNEEAKYTTREKRTETAVSVATKLAHELGKHIEAEYAQLNLRCKGNRQELARHYGQYEKVFVMEREMVNWLVFRFGVHSCNITCLDIPQEYESNEDKLAELIAERLRPHI